jgi:cell division septum initiation protein DivIVA
MTNPATRESFEVVRRGYEPTQVDRHVAGLQRELENHRRRADEAERRVQELHTQSPDEQKPAYSGLGQRIEQILGLADEEAQQVRQAAVEEATQHRSLTEQDAGKIRKDAERYAEERRADADTEAQRIVQEAKRAADTLRDESERGAKARREEAEALFENNRAKAAQAAADFETTLAHRRDQSERDFTEKMKANEQQLNAVSHRAEQLRLEAEKLRADSDRKSKRTLDEAARQADEIVAQAKVQADRIRTESERELSASTQRRDSINAQLTNVRQMLATLTGAALPDPIADEPTAPATPAAAAKSDQAVKGGQPAEGDQQAAGAKVPPSHVKTPDKDDDAGNKAPASPVAKDAQSTGTQSTTTVSPEKPSAAKR